MPRSARRSRRWSALPAALALSVAAACAHGSSAAPRPAHVASERDSVPVAYGTQDKKSVTGAIGSIDGENAPRGTARTMADLLDGHVPGVEVTRLAGGSVSVRIRGDRSFHADGEPLYVVDGIPMTGSTIMTDLDPRDVKSIEVLKDAGSLAAYGSRGANGVILIRLKKPPRP
jgi:TonB-dependent SusC/RagA subfamily outer membrane receptor